MCLIIHRPIGVEIPESILSSGMRANPDGWGIVAGRYSSKGLDASRFWDAYDASGDAELFIHFRFATHGSISLDNCHPFKILRGRYHVLHNGIIDIPIVDKARSDTWHYAHSVLAPALKSDPSLFSDPAFSNEVARQIGASKLVIVRNDGESVIVNRAMGADHDGLWLSNTHSLPYARSPWMDNLADDVWTLDDLRSLADSEISELCQSDPDLIASLIRERLDWDYESVRS